MWPKILMQLVELLPHVSRLAPMADRYFDSKATNERANEAALAAMAEGVQADLGQVAQAHLGLYRQLQEQSAQIATVGDDVRSVHSALEQSERRVAALEQKIATILLCVRVGVSVVPVLLLIKIERLVHARLGCDNSLSRGLELRVGCVCSRDRLVQLLL